MEITFRSAILTSCTRHDVNNIKKRRNFARKKIKQVAEEGNNCSPEEQLTQGVNIIRNSKRPLVEQLKLLELKPKPISA